MADEQGKIEIAVDFTGGQQATQQLGQMAAGLETVAESGAQATLNLDDLARGGSTVAQRVQGVAGAVQGLVGALGSQNRTAGLIASVAGSTAQFASMGAILGPGGAVVGGIAGLAAGLLSVADAHRTATPVINETADAIEREGEIASTAADRMRDFLSSISTAGRESELGNLANQITELTDEMYRLRDAGDNLGAEVIAERIRTLARFEAADRANITEENRTTGRAGRGGGGGEGALTEVDFNELARQRNAEIMAERLAETARVNDEELTLELERWEAENEAARQALDLRKEMEQAAYEARKELYIEEANERKRLAVEEFERQQHLDELALEQREKSIGEMTDLFGQTANALGGAIKSIATGEKSAEEAFKGLAAAFLEMISQYASLKAATEFADAAASFARYDYGGGTAHIGAGLAFTAVAVATGIGAAAINSPPQAPARPEAQTEQTAARGGDVILNWNSPLVTAMTRAELGRDISTLVGEAASI